MICHRVKVERLTQLHIKPARMSDFFNFRIAIGIAWCCQGAVSECVKGIGGVNVQTSEAGLSRSLFVRLERQ